MLELPTGDTRIFLFHSPGAASDPGAAMDKVNAWLGKDRSTTQYANLRVRDITVTADGQGGVFTTIVCSLGRMQQPVATQLDNDGPAI
ncbi:MAG: hypothetical protein ACJ789_07795 [Thermomicrobiales bacterium]